jgi:hypothetical protein
LNNFPNLNKNETKKKTEKQTEGKINRKQKNAKWAWPNTRPGVCGAW